ncbi:MAG: hypothetical protein HY698_04560 [Deltaproteobacteria bacterium]|nr:hypothetical protein [Deltaproteobacteria bacterium]
MKAIARVVAVTLLVMAPRPSRAENPLPPKADCTVTEIQASNEKKGVDPKLERLKGKLTKPPFSAWDTFVRLGEPGIKPEKDKPATVKLITGGMLTVVFKDKLLSQGGRPRLRFGLDVDSKEGKRTVSTVVVFDSGDSVLIAGEPHGKGTYIMAFGCTGQ